LQAVFSRSGPLVGALRVPGDKSISHRAAIVGALAEGTTAITGFSDGADCASTLRVLRGLGVDIDKKDDVVRVVGRGEHGFVQPRDDLDCGNSGTTMRLLAGAVAPWPLRATFTGDESLTRRPMSRIADPLRRMGATLTLGDETGHPPITVEGARLSGIDYAVPVASAQVKSAILLAGLGASGKTVVREKAPTRDHTERMLAASGIAVEKKDLSITLVQGVPLALDIEVPGDFSSAAFFLAAALMVPGSRVTVGSVGLNPTRTGFLKVLMRMGASIETDVSRSAPEPCGDIRVESGPLRGVEVSAEEVALAIDEVTLIALLATSAEGRTTISGAGELRHKESDRLAATVASLRAMGAMVEESAEGMTIDGPTGLYGARLDCGGDHRIAMMLAIGGLVAEGETVVDGWEWTRISYPGFEGALRGVGGSAG
jgi:3-phosphoshikimate 1-carboxyvinyltransferase